MHTFRFHLAKFSAENALEIKLTPQEETLLKEACKNPDYRTHAAMMNVLERKAKLAHPSLGT